MNSYYIQPGMGDNIYCLPVLKLINNEPFWIVTGLPKPLHEALTPLLLHQPYIAGVSHLSDGFCRGLVDFNDFRNVRPPGYMHICQRVAVATGTDLRDDHYKDGWLEPYRGNNQERYAVVSYTERYRDQLYTWHNELQRLKDTYETVYFIGGIAEWRIFSKKYGRSYCTFLQTRDLNEAAQVIQNAQEVSTTQTSTLAICQALRGRTYNFERSPTIDIVTLFTNRERILNSWTRKLCSAAKRVNNLVRLVKSR